MAHAIRIILEERTSVDWNWVAASLEPHTIDRGSTVPTLVDTVVLDLVQRSRVSMPEEIATVRKFPRVVDR